MVSVIHVADVHLGSIVSNLGHTKNAIRMREIEYTFSRIMNMCSSFDIALLPGDIFDSPTLSFAVADMFIKAVEACPHTYFFYSCGNHDPYISPLTDYIFLHCPSNLHIFGYEHMECVKLEELNTCVYGISFSSQIQTASLADDVAPCDPRYINLMCIHGDISNSGNYNPITLSALEQAGFDYVALGHIHGFSGVLRCGNMTYAYSGIPEPRGFDEKGAKGIIRGNVSKGFADLAFEEVSKRVYEDAYVDVSDCSDYNELIDMISAEITDPESIYQIHLTGTGFWNGSVDCGWIEKHINAFHVIVADETHTSFVPENYIEDVGLIGMCAGETLRSMESVGDDEKEHYCKAFGILVSLLDGGRG